MKRKQKIIALICALITTFSIIACGSFSTGKSSGVFNVNGVAFTDYSKDISADAIYDTINKFSATDNARITGSEGEKNTGDYISKYFRDLGFDVTEQSFPIKLYSCVETEVDIVAPESKIISSQFLAYSMATPMEGITADIVNGEMGTESDLDNAKVNGKLVLMKRGGDFYRIKVERAYSKGAVGAIFYDPNQEQPVAASLVEPSRIPAVSISRSDGESIEGMLASDKHVKVTLRVDSEIKDSISKNIIATKKSKKQSNDKNIVVGAHYDGVNTPAANDNASGIAALMEAARVVSKQKLDCDINFIAFGAEEIRSVGSDYYVTALSSEKISNIIAMINLDMVGVGDTLRIHTMREDAKSLPADLAVSCAKKFNYKYERNASDGSDHVAFETAGVPVAYLEYGPDENYHTDEDTIDKIQKEDLLRLCNVVVNMCRIIGKNPEDFSR